MGMTNGNERAASSSGIVICLSVLVGMSLAVILALSAATFSKVKQLDDSLTDPSTNLIPCDPSKPETTITTINGKTMAEFTRREDGKYAIPTKYVRTMASGLTNMTSFENIDGVIETIYTGIREAMTCMAIHIHPLGGHTCVLEGAAATVFVEGHEEKVYEAGTCYYMPPNVYMTSCNLGDTDSNELDVLLKHPDGKDTIVCEPYWDDVCTGRKCWIKDEEERLDALIIDAKQDILRLDKKLNKSEAVLADLQQTP